MDNTVLINNDPEQREKFKKSGEKRRKEHEAAREQLHTKTVTISQKHNTGKNNPASIRYSPDFKAKIDMGRSAVRRRTLINRNISKVSKKPFRTGFTSGVSMGLSDIDRKITMQTLGAKQEDFNKLEQAQDKTGYKIGEGVGFLASSLIPYSGAAKAVGTGAKGGSKVAKVIGRLPIKNQATKKVATRLGESVATDIVGGLPMNVAYSANQATTRNQDGTSFDKGEFAKNLAINEAMDLGGGVALEGAVMGAGKVANIAKNKAVQTGKLKPRSLNNLSEEVRKKYINEAEWEDLENLREYQAAKKNIQGEATNKINTPERMALREEIKEKLYKTGSAVVDDKGKVSYTGNVNRNRRADIVIGPPAAGKSSVVADPLSQKYGSRIIDSDEAKKLLPEFYGGIGAGRVHEESTMIKDDLMDIAVKEEPFS